MTFEGKWGILYVERAIEQILLPRVLSAKIKKNIALFYNYSIAKLGGNKKKIKGD